MRSLADVKHPKLGKYVKFRVGEGERESEIYHGMVQEYTTHGFILDSGARFDYEKGDRITWINNNPWADRPHHVKIGEDNRIKTVVERAIVQTQIDGLRKRILLLQVTVAAVTCLASFLYFYDGWDVTVRQSVGTFLGTAKK